MGLKRDPLAEQGSQDARHGDPTPAMTPRDQEAGRNHRETPSEPTRGSTRKTGESRRSHCRWGCPLPPFTQTPAYQAVPPAHGPTSSPLSAPPIPRLLGPSWSGLPRAPPQGSHRPSCLRVGYQDPASSLRCQRPARQSLPHPPRPYPCVPLSPPPGPSRVHLSSTSPSPLHHVSPLLPPVCSSASQRVPCPPRVLPACPVTPRVPVTPACVPCVCPVPPPPQRVSCPTPRVSPAPRAGGTVGSARTGSGGAARPKAEGGGPGGGMGAGGGGRRTR